MARARLRLPLLVLAAVVVAQVAVLLLLPREGVIDPAPVSVRSYFSAAELDRARDFRRPQLALYGASLVIQAGVLLMLVRRPPRRFPRRALAAGAAVSLVLTAATLPVRAISRERAMDVGLITQAWPDWAVDVVKGAAIGAVLAGLGAALATGLARRFGARWWVPGSVVVVAAAAAMVYAGPVVLDPVFNRFTPLPAGQTRADVLGLARRAGLDVGEVYEIDASRRTTAANAYVTGLGHTKRVVLYDTLIEGFTRDETRLVVAHELGHVHYDDVPHGLLFVALVAPMGMLAVTRLAGAWTRDDPRRWVPALALALGVVITPVTMISNQLSRRVEARADAYSLRLTGASDAFIRFERRLALRNVSDPDPPRLVRFLLSTHPPTIERIGIGAAYERERGRGGQATTGR